MADIFLTNSLARKKEKFEPLNPPDVGMYTCGPTVYDFQHIGNFRTMVLSDILHRVLRFNGYKVKSVRNITDIDDKTIKGASAQGVSLKKYTKKYTDIFLEDLRKLNILPVSANPKATEHIKEMVAYTKDLLGKGLAYLEKDGTVYFDISKFKNYGRLSKVKKHQLKTGTRTLSDEYTKDNIQDFALWKSVDKSEIGYDSPWGKGRPGWHIECSVMSQKHLGDTFDIHVGGVDLLFPHHENEIAQSEGKTGKKFVNYFVHGEFLQVDGKKMSKSLKNLYTVSDIKRKGFDPLALRYLYLTAHYKDPLNFTWDALSSAQKALERLKSQFTTTKRQKQRTALSPEKQKKVDNFRDKFSKAVNDDLSTPRALAVFWQALKSNIPSADKYDLVLAFDEVLGLKLEDVKEQKVEEIKTSEGMIFTTVPLSTATVSRVEARELARSKGDFAKADELRLEIREKDDLKIKDTAQGTIVEPAQNA